jgi:hypothetical protein
MLRHLLVVGFLTCVASAVDLQEIRALEPAERATIEAVYLKRIQSKCALIRGSVDSLDGSRSVKTEKSVLGINIDKSGFVVTNLDSLRGMSQITVSFNGKSKLSPKTIILLPEVGLAGIALQLETPQGVIPSTEISEAVTVHVVGSDLSSLPGPEVMIGLTSRPVIQTANANFIVDTSVGPAVSKGIVFDTAQQCVGIVVNEHDIPRFVRAKSVKAIEQEFAAWIETAKKTHPIR